jgi:hypothetical protein
MEKLLSKEMKVKKNTPLNTITDILSIGLDKYDIRKLKPNGASLKNIYDMLGIKSKLKGSKLKGSKLKGLKLKGSKLKGSKCKKNIKQLGGTGTIKNLSQLLKEQNTATVDKRCNDIIDSKNKFIKKSTYIPQVDGIQSPDDIIIFLNRGKYHKKTNTLERENTPINIDEELTFNNKTYYISAIVQNQSTVVESGHYTTLAKRGENKWKHLNDSTCTDINISEYLKNNTYGVIFLYRNKKEIKINTKGNGIENKGNTCYLNSLLQFLITTDEYQNNKKMIKTRPGLYKFLKDSTDKSKNAIINDGSTSQRYIKNFGFNTGQQESSDELLRKIMNFGEFKYKGDTDVFKLENNKFIQIKYNTVSDYTVSDYFVTNPPFYNYVTQIEQYPLDSDCKEVKKTFYEISHINILSKKDENEEKENENEEKENENEEKENENEDNKVNEGEVNEGEVNEGEKEEENENEDNKVNEGEVNEGEKEEENENEDNKVKENKEEEEEKEKPILEAIVINTGSDSRSSKYNEKSKLEGIEGIERVIEQLSIMKNTIPDIKNLKEAVVGKDMITELVRQEKIMKLITNNALINATKLKEQEENYKIKYKEDYKKNNGVINDKMKILNTKMNAINILFNKLFHRRNKLSNVPIVWVN